MSLRDLVVSVLFQDNASGGLNNINNNATGLGKTLVGIAATLGGIFALGKMKDLAIDMVEAAGEAEALNAQFETVFGTLQDDAQASIDSMAKEFGMLPSRLSPTFTKTTSMFKGFGMSTEDSMEAAGKSVELAADAAAFYDVSMSDASGALTSFLKGNTNAAESVGIFATAAGMASFASEKLGLNWKTLDEGGKQLVRLKYVESMQVAAEATGQAARESDGYENVLGNLKQAWTDLKAKLGDSIFDTAIGGMKGLAAWMSNIDTDKIVGKMKAFGGYMSDTFGPILNDLKSDFLDMKNQLQTAIKSDGMQSAFESLKDGMEWIGDNWPGIKETVIGVGTAVGSFLVIMKGASIVQAFNKALVSYRAGTLAATHATLAANLAMLSSPWLWMAVGIAAVVAGGVLLYRNWDTVKEKASELWGNLNALKDKGLGALQVKFEEFKETLVDLKDTAMQYVMDKVDDFKSKFDEFKDTLEENKGIIIGVASTLGIVFGPALIKVGIQAGVTAAQITGSFIASLIATSAQAIKTAATVTGQFIVSMVKSSIQAVATGAVVTTSFIGSLIASSAQAVMTAAVITGQFVLSLAKTATQAVITAGMITGSLIVSLASSTTSAWASVVAIGAQTLAFTAQKVGMAASAIAMGTLTAAQWALNVAMNANPLGLVVLGIAAVIAIGVLLYQNWDTVKASALSLWEGTKSAFGGIKDSASEKLQPVINFFIKMKEKWDAFVDAIKNFKMPKLEMPEFNMPKVGMPKWTGGNGLIQMDGSNANGLERVPYDGYISELHKDESVLTAQQSNSLRSMGILGSQGDLPVLNLPNGGSSPTDSPISASPMDSRGASSAVAKTDNHNIFNFHISGENAKDIGAEVRQAIDDIFAGLYAATP